MTYNTVVPIEVLQHWDDVHDSIAMWMKGTGQGVLKKALSIKSKDPMYAKQEWALHPALVSAKARWEWDHQTQQGKMAQAFDPIGYVDMVIFGTEKAVTSNVLAVVEFKGWRCDYGKTLRQVHRYKALLQAKFGVVVSPDTTYRGELESEGLLFIEVPAGILPWTREETSYSTPSTGSRVGNALFGETRKPNRKSSLPRKRLEKDK